MGRKSKRQVVQEHLKFISDHCIYSYTKSPRYLNTPQDIWINEELDIHRLKSNDNKYDIHINLAGIIYPSSNIYLNNPLITKKDCRNFKANMTFSCNFECSKGDPDLNKANENNYENCRKRIEERTVCTLDEYYKYFLPNITRKTLHSNDFLDKLITVYTIKKAQNGDTNAINKLHSIYLKDAERIAIRYKRKYKWMDKNELKSDASYILLLLISGDRPEEIYKIIENDEDTIQSTRGIINKAFKHICLNKILFKYYMGLDDYYTQLPTKEEDIVQLIKKEAEKRGEKITENNITTIMSILSFNLDPRTWFVGDPEFNKDVYKPTKNGSLYTFLFGSRGKKDKRDFDGRFILRFNDLIKCKYFIVKNGKRIPKIELSIESIPDI